MPRTPIPLGAARPGDGRATSQSINLALQGGGAHGAFTWGALDRLLEEERHRDRGNQRHLRRRDERHRPQARLGARRPRRRAEWLERFWLRVAGLDGAIGEAMLDWLRARLALAGPHLAAARAQPRACSPARR